MPMTPKELIKLLKKNGFEEISQNGSHIKMKNFETGRQTIIPLHSKALKKGLEQAILKQAGIKK
ncbi:MAG: type II toxin-antitoxin system HicA family toxin [Firmicutes bacterium]|nr:type II toxin-antitoxin system HicA family toxin [Bacillota bacterium]MBR2594001.1 type II toxin-antitoxin system HicA family toxin [Bacillota bacterium]